MDKCEVLVQISIGLDNTQESIYLLPPQLPQNVLILP